MGEIVKAKPIELKEKSGSINFAATGIIAAGGLICGNMMLAPLVGSVPDSTIYPLSMACIVSGALLQQLFRHDKTSEIFKNCGLVNKDGKLPLVIKKKTKDDITTMVIHMPPGISQHHFEQKKEELEQAFNCKIEFGFNKNLVMKLIKFSLGTMYPYEFQERESPTEVFIGNTHEGPFYFDIDRATQTLVAGEPNSGKTSLLRTLILSLLLSKHKIDLHLIDFQGVELGIFQDCRKVKSYGETPEDFSRLLDDMEAEAEKRLKLFASVRRKHYIQKLSVWNKTYPDKALPYKVCIVDEFARLAEDEYKGLMDRFRTRVAMDRKVGILYIASMQRPDVKVISGSIKGNMPTRIAFKTVTDTDSEVILDVKGAEKIKNQGRCIMKYLGELKEVQCLYIEPEDVRKWLKRFHAYKTPAEIEQEKRERMKALRGVCINPYIKRVQ